MPLGVSLSIKWLKLILELIPPHPSTIITICHPEVFTFKSDIWLGSLPASEPRCFQQNSNLLILTTMYFTGVMVHIVTKTYVVLSYLMNEYPTLTYYHKISLRAVAYFTDKLQQQVIHDLIGYDKCGWNIGIAEYNTFCQRHDLQSARLSNYHSRGEKLLRFSLPRHAELRNKISHPS